CMERKDTWNTGSDFGKIWPHEHQEANVQGQQQQSEALRTQAGPFRGAKREPNSEDGQDGIGPIVFLPRISNPRLEKQHGPGSGEGRLRRRVRWALPATPDCVKAHDRQENSKAAALKRPNQPFAPTKPLLGNLCLANSTMDGTRGRITDRFSGLVHATAQALRQDGSLQ